MAHVEIILDRSGSMQSVREETISGFNGFVKEQPKGTRFSLTQFDSRDGVSLEKTFDDVPKSDKPRLSTETFTPRGLTPLYDAVGTVLRGLLDRKPRGKVVVLIITDGHENASRDYDRKSVTELIDQAKKKGWQVVFMGADIDAYAEAGSLGIAGNQTMSYASVDTSRAYSGVSSASSGYLSGITATMDVEDVKED